MKDKSNRNDKTLGVGCPITRRDFIGSTLIGTGAALLNGCTPKEQLNLIEKSNIADPWTGYGGVGDYSTSNGNTKSVMDAAHLIRDGKSAKMVANAKPTGEQFDMVVIGGGFSGLGAAYQFHAKAEGKTCLILDNHPVFGGEAKENEFQVKGHRLFGPQGSNGFMPPVGNNTLSEEVWKAVGVPMNYEFADDNQDFGMRVAHDSYEAMFWGEKKLDVGHLFQKNQKYQWQKNIWDDDLSRTPWSADLKRDLLKAFNGKDTAHSTEGLGPWLDSMTYQNYLEKELGLHPGVGEHMDPVMAISSYGFSSDVISAYGAYLLQLPGMNGYFKADTFDFESAKFMSFPGGNTTYARYIVNHLIPGVFPNSSFEKIAHGGINFDALDKPGNATRIRLSSTALDVRHKSDGVEITYLCNGKAEKISAKSVVMATGGWVSRNIVQNLPENIESSYRQFNHAPVLVVNVALNNWKFLEKLGFAAARWYDGFGFFGSIRSPMKVGNKTAPYDPSKPMVMTFYVPFYARGQSIKAQGAIGRAQLFNKSYLDYEREIRNHMNQIFGSAGFDAKRDIAGIILNRWGHAYVAPQPGFYFGGSDGKGLAAPIKKGFDGIYFGHSELGARMNYTNAIAEGGRAGAQAAQAAIS